MNFKEIKSELSMTREYVKSNILSAAELRTSFIMQIVGMAINNISLLAIWLLFFNAFGSINGWSGLEVMALQGFIAISFGFTFSFFSGVMELPKAVLNGSFDSVLLTPRNLYLRILTLATRTSSVGDMLYGFIVLIFYIVAAHLSLVQVVLFLLLLIPSVLILVNFALITSCICFYIPDSEQISNNAFEVMFGPSLYPSGVYQGAMRTIFLFVLPTIAVAGLPVEAVKDLNFLKIGFVWGVGILWTLIAFLVLKHGIRKYESGNLTGARV